VENSIRFRALDLQMPFARSAQADCAAAVFAKAERMRAVLTSTCSNWISIGRTIGGRQTGFTKDEWTLLLKSPMIAGMAITAASL
jgi:hypothetical protein